MTGFTAENRLLNIQLFSVCYLSGINCIFIRKCSLIFFQNHFFRYSVSHKNIPEKFPFRPVCSSITFLFIQHPGKFSHSNAVSTTWQNLLRQSFPVQFGRFFCHLRISVSRNKNYVRFFRQILHKYKIFDLFQKFLIHFVRFLPYLCIFNGILTPSIHSAFFSYHISCIIALFFIIRTSRL